MKEEKIQDIFQTIRKLPPNIELSAIEQFILLQPATIYTPPSGGGGTSWLNIKNSFIMISSITVVGIAVQVFLHQKNNVQAPNASTLPPADSNSKTIIHPLNLDTSPPAGGVMYGPVANGVPKSLPKEIEKEEVAIVESGNTMPPKEFSYTVVFPVAPIAAIKEIKQISPIINGERVVPEFSEIELQCDANVEVVSGDGYSIKSDDERMVSEFAVIVKDNRLQVRQTSAQACGNKSDLIITMPSDKLRKVQVTGSGNITLRSDFTGLTLLEVKSSGNIYSEKTIHASDLAIRLIGSGTIDVKDMFSKKVLVDVWGSGSVYNYGNAETLKVTVTGSGSADMGKFMAKNVEAILSGSGDIYIHVHEKLTAEITGSGAISYYGSPSAISSSVTGSGELHKME